MWNFFRHRAIKKRVSGLVRARYTIPKSFVKKHNPEEYQRLLIEEEEEVKKAVERAILEDGYTRKVEARIEKEIQEQNTRLSARESNKISRRIYQLSEERHKLERKRDLNYEKSGAEDLTRKAHELKHQASDDKLQAQYKEGDIEKAGNRRQRRMYTQVFREWSDRAKKSQKEYEKANQLAQKALNRLGRQNDPLNAKINHLSQEIRELETKLEGDYKKNDSYSGAKIVSSNSETAKEVNNIRREIARIETSRGKFNHIKVKREQLHEEFSFRGRFIAGEGEKAQRRRIDKAFAWYNKKTDQLDKEEERYRSSMSSRSHSTSWDSLKLLRERLERLEPQLEEELASEKRTRRELAEKKEQERLVQDALARIRHLSQDGNF